MKIGKLIFAIIFGIAGFIASIDIILAEFFDKGNPPESSFLWVLMFIAILGNSSISKQTDIFDHFKQEIVVYPIYLSFILYLLSEFSII